MRKVYAVVEAGFITDPKTARLDCKAMMLYIAGLIHCQEHLTDGLILDVFMPWLASVIHEKNARKQADQLVEVGYWESVEGGYRVHAYLKHNRSRVEVEKLGEKRAVAGKRGGRTRELEDYYDFPDDEASDDVFANQHESTVQANAEQFASKTEPSLSLSNSHSNSDSTKTEANASVGGILGSGEEGLGDIGITKGGNGKTPEGEFPMEQAGRAPGARQEQWAMMRSVAEVCQVDARTFNRGRLAKAAKKLRDASYTPGQVRAGFGAGSWWYDKDWRGRQGQPPTPEQVSDLILQAVASDEPPRAGPRKSYKLNPDGTVNYDD